MARCMTVGPRPDPDRPTVQAAGGNAFTVARRVAGWRSGGCERLAAAWYGHLSGAAIYRVPRGGWPGAVDPALAVLGDCCRPTRADALNSGSEYFLTGPAAHGHHQQ